VPGVCPKSQVTCDLCVGPLHGTLLYVLRLRFIDLLSDNWVRLVVQFTGEGEIRLTL
jgi:hypothetical protein